MRQDKELIKTARNLVRRGYFALAASDVQLMSDLERIERAEDIENATLWFSARSLLAEIHDQTGKYHEVSKLFAYDDVSAALARMKKARDRVLRKQSSVMEEEQRRFIRAAGLWVLQGAISRLRRFELDGAGRLMAECQDTIESLRNTPMRFHALKSLLHYWQGRVLILKNRPAEARSHFHAAMRQTERNLEFHLPIQQKDDRVIFAVYSLASCTAFGLAQLSHMTGELEEAINLLHPALAMLMGTGDNYRRAAALMMMGAAERALAGADPKRLAKSIDILEASLRLFGSKANKGLAHGLHEARVQYQLSLAHLYRAQGLRSSEESTIGKTAESDRAINKAVSYNEGAWKRLVEFDRLGYADPQLKCDVLVERSRICRYQLNYEEAWKNANAALKLMRDYSYAEPSGKANGLIARGEALVAKAAGTNPSTLPKADREALLQRAQDDFEHAATVEGNTPTIAAVTGLHLANVFAMRGDLPAAQLRFQQAWDHNEGIENGWVRQLAHEVRQRVQLPSSVFLLDVKKLEKEKPEGRLYDAAKAILRDFMLERSRQTDAGIRRTPDEAARYLGVSRPTYFNWSRPARQALKARNLKTMQASTRKRSA